jgi:hypothetical protein
LIETFFPILFPAFVPGFVVVYNHDLSLELSSPRRVVEVPACCPSLCHIHVFGHVQEVTISSIGSVFSPLLYFQVLEGFVKTEFEL